MVRLLVITLAMATAAQAETPAEPKSDTCQSCTARHNALKKLQEARVPAPPSAPATEKPAAQEKKSE